MRDTMTSPANDLRLPRLFPPDDPAPLTDPEIAKRAGLAVLRRAQRARTSLVDFFEFVLRDEMTQDYLRVLPHQRVMLDFIEKHSKSVIFMPPGFAKTFTASGITLWMLGNDPSTRAAYISATEAQTRDPLQMVRSYIETSARLRLVFPDLRRTTRKGEPWTVNSLVVDRPYGIRTPSLMGCGMDSKRLPGKRIKWLVIDDILTRDNTATKAQRDKVHTWIDSTALARLDPADAKAVMLNTAWHPDDLLHRAERAGWPTLRMSILGSIKYSLPPVKYLDGTEGPDTWGIDDEIAPHVRPEVPGVDGATTGTLRLTAHDPDPLNQVPLWPERHSVAVIDNLRRTQSPAEFNRVQCQVCRDDDTALCKVEWIELAKRLAREAGIYSLQSKPTARAKWCVIGVDLAVSPGEEHDDTAIVTFEVWDDGTRLLLDVDCGQLDGPTIVDKIIAKWEQYRVREFDPLVMVENNAAQDFIKQFTRAKNKLVPIDGLTTGRAKAHPDTGVPAFFIEMRNGAWLIPNDQHGKCHPQVQRLVDACLYYTPTNHTDDVLMALYMARERARQLGIPSGGNAGPSGGGLGFDLLAR
jgi:hypothetical protein